MLIVYKLLMLATIIFCSYAYDKWWAKWPVPPQISIFRWLNDSHQWNFLGHTFFAVTLCTFLPWYVVLSGVVLKELLIDQPWKVNPTVFLPDPPKWRSWVDAGFDLISYSLGILFYLIP